MQKEHTIELVLDGKRWVAIFQGQVKGYGDSPSQALLSLACQNEFLNWKWPPVHHPTHADKQIHSARKSS